MPTVTMERRRFRRAEVDVPITIRPLDKHGALGQPIAGQIKDISLAGVYCYVNASGSCKPGDAVICSATMSPEQARQFPFARVMGRGWIVRVEEIPTGRREGEAPPNEPRVGLVIAFTPDVTALASIEV